MSTLLTRLLVTSTTCCSGQEERPGMITSRLGARPDNARPGVLSRHPLVSFFLIAYAGAWLLELPIVLSRTGTGLLPYTLPPIVVVVAIAAATFTGPTLSA